MIGNVLLMKTVLVAVKGEKGACISGGQIATALTAGMATGLIVGLREGCGQLGSSPPPKPGWWDAPAPTP